MTWLDELSRLLRPAGGGIHTVSTGRAEQLAFQRGFYRVTSEADIEAAWRRSLTGLPRARVALLGVPSDTGAGIRRGAAWGPLGVRTALAQTQPQLAEHLAARGVVDLGDVRTNPHLLADEMLAPAQVRACQDALYPDVPAAERATWPVAPLSVAERALALVFAAAPATRVLVIGGDHSVAWPAVAALARTPERPDAIVHIDAHTDLLPERQGVRLSFATWAYHANELLGRGGRLLQVGVRASGRAREHWEGTLGVRQWWAAEVGRDEDVALDAISRHLDALGATRVYLSNDIDGTTAEEAPATGTPEPDGLSAAFVHKLIERLGQERQVVGADLCEVAPPLGDEAGSRRTCALGAAYVLCTLEAMARGSAP